MLLYRQLTPSLQQPPNLHPIAPIATIAPIIFPGLLLAHIHQPRQYKTHRHIRQRLVRPVQALKIFQRRKVLHVPTYEAAGSSEKVGDSVVSEEVDEGDSAVVQRC